MVTAILSLLGVVAVFPLSPSAWAAEAPGAARVSPPEETPQEARIAPEPALVPEVLRFLPAAQVAAATVESIRNQPSLPGVPYRNGFSRSGAERRVEVAPATLRWVGEEVGAVVPTSSSTASWYGRFVVEDAYAFRIMLRNLHLPKDGRIWVHAGDVQLGPFGRELLDPEGNLWLPPAPGPEVVVEIELATGDGGDASHLSFTLGEVMELLEDSVGTSVEPAVWTDCDIDAMCIDTATLATIDELREAIARLSFVEGAFSYLCTGGLLNDKDPTGFRPYLLTAHHCFGSQTVASSLVAYFDYRTDGCNGTVPSLWSVPSVAGATLLATGATSDFTLVELSGVPSGNTWFLGWTTADPTSGSSMERVSHPEGTAQKFSASSFTGSSGIVCGGLPTTDFHYSQVYVGSTAGGSSGSPVTQNYGGDPLVVGQLLGACHYSVWDDCSYSTYNNIDGAFSSTYPYVKYWINDLTGCGDSYEPDDSAAQASPIASGSPQNHSICPAGDEDWVSFTLGEESAVTLETSGPSGDTRMWLYDFGLAQVEYDDDGGTGLFSAIDRLCGVDALPAGTYYVKVDEYGDNDEIASYDLAYTFLESCGGGCPADLVLSNTTISGTHSYRAGTSITLGPSLVINGTSVDTIAGQRVVITSGTEIGGSFSAGTDPNACSP